MKPHTHGPDDMPEALCRQCHPELNQTPEANAAFYAELRERERRERHLDNLERQLRRARQELPGLQKRSERSETAAKIAASIERKITRLEGEVAAARKALGTR